MNKILENKAQCLKCKDILISELETIPVTCSCGSISIYGGKVTLVRTGSSAITEGVDYKEMSKFLLTE